LLNHDALVPPKARRPSFRHASDLKADFRADLKADFRADFKADFRADLKADYHPLHHARPCKKLRLLRRRRRGARALTLR